MTNEMRKLEINHVQPLDDNFRQEAMQQGIFGEMMLMDNSNEIRVPDKCPVCQSRVYINGYEKIVYNLDDTPQEAFPVLRFFEVWLDNEANEMLFVKKILNKKEKNWIVNLIKPFLSKD